MAQENEDNVVVRLDANAMIKVLDQFFEVPDNISELLTIGGLTDRQKKAITLLSQGSSIEEITMALAPENGGVSKQGKGYTYNTYDALNGGINKIIRAFCLVQALRIDNSKELVNAIFERADKVGGKTKRNKNRYVLPMKNRKPMH
jgi:transcriptional regulator